MSFRNDRSVFTAFRTASAVAVCKVENSAEYRIFRIQESRCILDSITSNPTNVCCAYVAFIVLATECCKARYKMVMQRFPVFCYGISHLSLGFAWHTHLPLDSCVHWEKNKWLLWHSTLYHQKALHNFYVSTLISQNNIKRNEKKQKYLENLIYNHRWKFGYSALN